MRAVLPGFFGLRGAITHLAPPQCTGQRPQRVTMPPVQPTPLVGPGVGPPDPLFLSLWSYRSNWSNTHIGIQNSVYIGGVLTAPLLAQIFSNFWKWGCPVGPVGPAVFWLMIAYGYVVRVTGPTIAQDARLQKLAWCASSSGRVASDGVYGARYLSSLWPPRGRDCPTRRRSIGPFRACCSSSGPRGRTSKPAGLVRITDARRRRTVRASPFCGSGARDHHRCAGGMIQTRVARGSVRRGSGRLGPTWTARGPGLHRAPARW